MKKRLQVDPDVAGLIIKMEQQFASLEKKIDTLISQSLPRPAEVKHFPKPFSKQDNSYRERVLHKAICADCRKECEVPFKPREDRPVYCKECFAKRRAGSSLKERSDNRPREAGPVQVFHIDKPKVVEKKKSVEKKKAVSKKREKRS